MHPGFTTGFRFLSGATLVSIGGHAVAWFVMPHGASASMQAHTPRIDVVEFVVEPLPTPPEPPSVPEPPAGVSSPRPRTPDRRPTPVTPPPSLPSDPLPTPTETPPELAPPARPNTPPEVVRIDPTAAARSVLALEGPRMPRPAETAPSATETEAERDRRLERELNGALTTAANARPWGRGFELPEPVRRPDGTLAYALGQITGIVNPDGSFTFDDAPGVRFGGMGNADREGMQVGWGMEEWLMRRHGDDPHASMRRRFADMTESMRDRMAEQHLAQQATRAARGMRGRLTRLLADETQPIERRRQRIFQHWDECAEGELVADAVREAIVTFVRENLAPGGELAYPEAELDELNRTRESTAEFRPYGP